MIETVELVNRIVLMLNSPSVLLPDVADACPAQYIVNPDPCVMVIEADVLEFKIVTVSPAENTFAGTVSEPLLRYTTFPESKATSV